MTNMTQNTTLLETLINTENISLEALESFLMKLHEKKIQEVQSKESDSITSMQDIRARLDRLNAIFRDINFTLLWKDRVCKTLGRTAEGLRWELYRHRYNNMVGKYSASFYEAVSFNNEYLKVAIDTVIALEKERGLRCVVYKSNGLKAEQEKEFCVSDIVNMTNLEFSDWFSRRLNDFSLMFGVKKYNTHELDFRKTAESIFGRALSFDNVLYDKRIYGDRFDKCGHEISHVRRNMSHYHIEDVYNCESATPCYQISRETIREYIVVVARQCLVV